MHYNRLPTIHPTGEPPSWRDALLKLPNYCANFLLIIILLDNKARLKGGFVAKKEREQNFWLKIFPKNLHTVGPTDSSMDSVCYTFKRLEFRAILRTYANRYSGR